MNLNNPFASMRARDWALWLCSLAVVAVSNFLGGDVDPLTLIAALTGVTALMLAAKGQVFAQYLMIVFCLLYGAISCRFRYWGEMLTYLGMSLPMAVWSAVTWRRNTAHEAGSAVAIRRLTGRDMALLVLATAAVTAAVPQPLQPAVITMLRTTAGLLLVFPWRAEQNKLHNSFTTNILSYHPPKCKG